MKSGSITHEMITTDKDYSSEFDAFRVLVSFASNAANADLFIETFTSVGLIFDLALSTSDNYSHSKRIRALLPRVLTAYDTLTPAGRLIAASAALGVFIAKRQQSRDNLLAALAKIGWGFQEDRLVALDPQIREMFFPRDSQWDAFVAVRKVIDKVEKDLLVVDPYCDRALFGILVSSGLRPMTVRLLCRNNPGGLKAEALVFVSQHPEVKMELRTSSDFHDRFLVVDQSVCVHIGSSLNHAGSRAFMISNVEDVRNRDALISAVNEAWIAGTPV